MLFFFFLKYGQWGSTAENVLHDMLKLEMVTNPSINCIYVMGKVHKATNSLGQGQHATGAGETAVVEPPILTEK